VSVGTVTAQLLYEIQGVQYANPDANVWFNSIRLEQEGPDRVRVYGVRGAPGPEQTKVAINYLGGYRNSMTLVLTGLDIEAKARHAETLLFGLLGGRDGFVSWQRTSPGMDARQGIKRSPPGHLSAQVAACLRGCESHPGTRLAPKF